MKKLTEAQSRLVERAKRKELSDKVDAIRAAKSLEQVWERQGNTPEGYTSLHGNADFRVAYALREMGLGHIATRCPFETKFFILRT